MSISIGFNERWKYFSSTGNKYEKQQINLFFEKGKQNKKNEDLENHHLI